MDSPLQRKCIYGLTLRTSEEFGVGSDGNLARLLRSATRVR